MKGFFEIESRKKRPTNHIKEPPASKELCEVCGLYKKCASPKMEYSGEGRKGILVLAEAPGATEDKQGTQLVGEAGQLFRKCLAKHNIDLDRDCWEINAVNCRPTDSKGSNRTPTGKEIKCCKPKVDQAIQELKPKFIWLMGGKAVDSFYMGRGLGLGTTALHHHCIPDRLVNAWVLPMFHPSYVLRNKDGIMESVFNGDLRWAVSCLSRKPFEFQDYADKVVPLLKFDEVAAFLNTVLNNKPKCVIDYETSGIKLYQEGHRIYTVAIATSTKSSYAFPLQWTRNVFNTEAADPQWGSRLYWNDKEYAEILLLLGQVLQDEKIEKVAQNIKFEHKWARNILGIETKGWQWDTMVASHILDSRQGLTGLKTQAFLRWGVEGYEKEVKPYIEKVGPDGFNMLRKFPLEKLLLYNGLDSLFECMLEEEQKKQFRGKKDLLSIYNLFHDGVLALADAEDAGICVDMDYYSKEHDRLTEEIDRLKSQLLHSRESRLFKAKQSKPVDLGSPKDLGILFYDLLKYKPPKVTGKGHASVDEEALGMLKFDWAVKLVERRKLLKVRDTYLGQFSREAHNGKLHPCFNLHIAASGRSSSDSPNFQNIPKRDEQAKKSVRSGIVPSPGNKLMGADYSQIEVRIQACYSHDSNLIRYIKDPTTDMHRDQAKEIFFLDDDQVTEPLRHIGKNSFVFPQWYGDWYKACAASIWKEMGDKTTTNGVLVREHLINKGIRNYSQFENHIKFVEDKFWRLFSATKAWRDDVVADYQRLGYVGSFFGFRRCGYLRRNQIINTPVQGAAFHCLLWSFNRLNEIRKKEEWKTKIIGQIHDEILFDGPPAEEDYVKQTVRRVMCEDIKEGRDWLIVPLEVKFSVYGESWYKKDKV